MEESYNTWPRLVGTTADIHQGIASGTFAREALKQEGREERCLLETLPNCDGSHSHGTSNYFKNAGWSPDGTTILSSSYDNTLRSFVLPPDLLSPDDTSPHVLTPYSSHHFPEPVYATDFYPGYDLQQASTCLVLASPRCLPIRLFSPFAPGILASYPLVSPTTEVFIAPHSLLFSYENPNHFFAGTNSRLSVFDINRCGEGPISMMHTTPSRRYHTAAAGGVKGIVSTMAMSSDGLLAAGTFSRWVGLYDGYGRGETVAVFSVAQETESEEGVGANGLTQVLWSPCGKYLCTVERGSDGIGVLDIRGHRTWLAWLKGRNARTQQRLSVDLVGGEVWAGGIDGTVRSWAGLGMTEGVIDPKWEFHAHGDVVSSTAIHKTGSVLATCSGQRHYNTRPEPANEESDDDTSSSSDSSQSSMSSLSSRSQSPPAAAFDNSLKIWAL